MLFLPAVVAVWTIWVTVEMEGRRGGGAWDFVSEAKPVGPADEPECGVESRVSATSWDPAGHPCWARDSPWWGCGLLGKSVV